jgi:hypothetical protein
MKSACMLFGTTKRWMVSIKRVNAVALQNQTSLKKSLLQPTQTWYSLCAQGGSDVPSK